MDLQVFRNNLLEKRPQLEVWGRFVHSQIKTNVQDKPVSLQITGSRAKDIDSAIGKIARKNYHDPFIQMTDLVGTRFVVLISPQVDIISKVVESCTAWEWTLDRDWQEDIQEAPESFGYQSRHYVVRSKQRFTFEDIEVDEGLPCEIQIRTIMQHAYAEMMHDNIYKATGKVPHKAKRFAASSMALIETADHLFCETMHLLEEENRPRNQLWEELVNLYGSRIGEVEIGYDERLNLEILDQCDDYIAPEVFGEIQTLLRDRPGIVDHIKSRTMSDPFWAQPTSIFAFWLVQKDPRHAIDVWPFASAHDALGFIYSYFGISQARRH